MATVLAVLASSMVAVVVVRHLALSGDEFYTLGEAREPSLSEVIRTYRALPDSTPPAGYVLTWIVSLATGSGPDAIRTVSVLAWMAASAAICAFLRRLRPLAVFVGGCFASLTGLAALGATARAYAVVVALVALAALAWQRIVAGSTSPWPVVALAGSLGLAVSFHYATVAVVPAFVIAQLVADREGRPGRRRTLTGLAIATAALAPALLLLSRSIAAQGRQSGRISPVTPAAFYVSVGLTAVPFLIVIAVLLLVSPVRRQRRLEDTGLDRPTIALATGLVALVPIQVAIGMAFTSGYYAHRYAAPAIVGASLLVAGAVQALSRSRAVVVVVGAAVVLTLPLSTWRAEADAPSKADAAALAIRLGLEPHARLICLDPYSYLLLTTYGPHDLTDHLSLSGPSVVAGTGPATVDLDADLASGAPVSVIGRREEVEAAADRSGRRAVIVHRANLPYEDTDHEFVVARLE